MSKLKKTTKMLETDSEVYKELSDILHVDGIYNDMYSLLDRINHIQKNLISMKLKLANNRLNWDSKYEGYRAKNKLDQWAFVYRVILNEIDNWYKLGKISKEKRDLIKESMSGVYEEIKILQEMTEIAGHYLYSKKRIFVNVVSAVIPFAGKKFYKRCGEELGERARFDKFNAELQNQREDIANVNSAVRPAVADLIDVSKSLRVDNSKNAKQSSQVEVIYSDLAQRIERDAILVDGTDAKKLNEKDIEILNRTEDRLKKSYKVFEIVNNGVLRGAQKDIAIAVGEVTASFDNKESEYNNVQNIKSEKEALKKSEREAKSLKDIIGKIKVAENMLGDLASFVSTTKLISPVALKMETNASYLQEIAGDINQAVSRRMKKADLAELNEKFVELKESYKEFFVKLKGFDAQKTILKNRLAMIEKAIQEKSNYLTEIGKEAKFKKMGSNGKAQQAKEESTENYEMEK